MPRTKTHHDQLPETFEELCRHHLPRPITDEVEYDNTVEAVNALAVLNKRTKDQEQYLHTLSLLVAEYDQEHYAIEPVNDPVRMLRFFMKNHDLSASDVGRIMGARELGSAVLRGDRQISNTGAFALAKHFGVSPLLFIKQP